MGMDCLSLYSDSHLIFAWQFYKERLLRKYYDEKINFFVNTAHNIRTPLSLVLAPLVDLSKDSLLSEKSRVFWIWRSATAINC